MSKAEKVARLLWYKFVPELHGPSSFQGILSHVESIKEATIKMDLSIIVSRFHEFFPQGMPINYGRAIFQNDRGTRAMHAAHGTKHLYVAETPVAEVVKPYSPDYAAHLEGVQGVVTTEVPKLFNLSIDRVLEMNPVRLGLLNQVSRTKIHNSDHAVELLWNMERTGRLYYCEHLDRLMLKFKGEKDVLRGLELYRNVLTGPYTGNIEYLTTNTIKMAKPEEPIVTAIKKI